MTKFSAPQQNQLAQIGAFLRDNREKQAKSLEDIAIRTYIRPQLLNGIETGNPDTLPEPIFVQGFIRRYAEALGLNGVELSQQFMVTSIPSTPRPVRVEQPADSPTTRFTRVNGAGAQSNTAADDSIPMFSAGSIPTTPVSSTPDTQDDLLTLGKPERNPAFETNPDFAAVESARVDAEEIPNADAAFADAAFPDSSFSETPAETPAEAPIENEFIDSKSSLESGIATDKLGASSLSSDAALSEDFASQVAAFDRDNLNNNSFKEPNLADSKLNEPTLGEPNFSEPGFDQPDSTPNSLNSQTSLEPAQFDDDLPAAFTTQSAAQPTAQSTTQLSEPFSPQTAREPQPVGVEYGDRPNLKPFIIGGVLAAVALGVLLLATIFGGNREAVVVDSSGDSAEQVDEGANELPPMPETETPEPVATQPPASTAPVYVEATATAEAWVSVIADGNPIFEGTLQPGDAEVWEAEENLNIYSGDAGALELAANGDAAEVMGERGQPEEKVFPQ